MMDEKSENQPKSNAKNYHKTSTNMQQQRSSEKLTNKGQRKTLKKPKANKCGKSKKLKTKNKKFYRAEQRKLNKKLLNLTFP